MMRFLRDRRLVAVLTLLPAVLATPTLAVESHWVCTGVTGRLIYVPDPEGDRIPDFSMVGYAEGKREIPTDIPVLITKNPRGAGPDGIGLDDTAEIQSAIDFVGSQPLQPNGFRGAVQLGPGKFFPHKLALRVAPP